MSNISVSFTHLDCLDEDDKHENDEDDDDEEAGLSEDDIMQQCPLFWRPRKLAAKDKSCSSYETFLTRRFRSNLSVFVYFAEILTVRPGIPQILMKRGLIPILLEVSTRLNMHFLSRSSLDKPFLDLIHTMLSKGSICEIGLLQSRLEPHELAQLFRLIEEYVHERSDSINDFQFDNGEVTNDENCEDTVLKNANNDCIAVDESEDLFDVALQLSTSSRNPVSGLSSLFISECFMNSEEYSNILADAIVQWKDLQKLSIVGESGQSH